MKAQTKETQAALTPAQAKQLLIEGNDRFVNAKQIERDLMDQVSDTSTGQFPFATVLSCIDSRVSAELIFDQGVGDLFSIRVAGNFVNEDVLGSMEFATKVAGSKVLVVLGHSSCGAVKGACDDVHLGNLTALLSKIKPAVEAVTEPKEDRNSKNSEFVENVSKKNVELTMENIKSSSPVLAEMISNNEIELVGAMYNVSTGKVEFYS